MICEGSTGSLVSLLGVKVVQAVDAAAGLLAADVDV